MDIRIVTDSTSDLPPELASSVDVKVVPLKVRFGDEEFRDGIDLSADDFYERLTNSPVLPTTSQPSVAEFIDVYEELGQGCDGIVSVHISSKLSGTYNSAIQAKEQAKVNCQIEVIDTLQASMGLGLVALTAAREAKNGAAFDEVVSLAREISKLCQCFLLVDTLEYLEKGGRIGKARALFGTLLKIKPLIIVRDGETHELGKERTHSRAIARLQQVAKDFSPLQELSVMYSTSPDEAHALARSLSGLLPDNKEPFITQFGPVIGTYTGPNALGIGLLRAE